MSDFVKPESVRLPLIGGQFIDVKKRLSAGEREDMYATMSPSMTAGGGTTLDRKVVRVVKVLTYLVGWSLTDDGQPVPMSPVVPTNDRIDIIRSLSTERFDEIHAAITAHEDGVPPAKKLSDGATESPVISPSPSDAAGVIQMFGT